MRRASRPSPSCCSRRCRTRMGGPLALPEDLTPEDVARLVVKYAPSAISASTTLMFAVNLYAAARSAQIVAAPAAALAGRADLAQPARAARRGRVRRARGLVRRAGAGQPIRGRVRRRPRRRLRPAGAGGAARAVAPRARAPCADRGALSRLPRRAPLGSAGDRADRPDRKPGRACARAPRYVRFEPEAPNPKHRRRSSWK